MKLKYHGYMLLSAVLSAILFLMLASSFAMLYSGQFSRIESGKVALQAQGYAEIAANNLKLTSYDDLMGYSRRDIEGAEGWQEESILGEEKVIGEDNRQRIATIKIYRSGDTTSRYSTQIPLFSKGGSSFDGLLSKNGWVKFDNGLIMQWGTGSASYWASFPKKFPNEVLQVVSSNRSGRGSIGPAYTQANTSSVYVELHEFDGGENRRGYEFGYIAIGY